MTDAESIRADATALITASLAGGPPAVDALLEQMITPHLRAGQAELIDYTFRLAGVLVHHAATLHAHHFGSDAALAQQRLGLALARDDGQGGAGSQP